MKMGTLSFRGIHAASVRLKAAACLMLLGIVLLSFCGCGDDESDAPVPPGYQEPLGAVWLFDMWADSPSNVWLVGRPGVILHFDGDVWTLEQVEQNSLTSIWGESANDLYVACDQGKILHYDGSGWTEMDTGVEENIFDVGRGPFDEIYAVGYEGTALRLDGGQWVDTDNDVHWYSQQDTLLRDEDIVSLTTVTRYGIGGSDAVVLMEDFPDSNNYWRKGPIEDDSNSWITASASGPESGDNLFGNEAGRLFQLRYDEIEDMLTWAEVPSPASLPAPITDISLTPDGQDYFFSTRWGLVSHMSADWSVNETIFDARDLPADLIFSGVLALAIDDVYVCGYDGLLMHWDGTDWEFLDVPLPDVSIHQQSTADEFGREIQ